jgi:predicted nuclease with TOPRIM domain
MTTFGGKRNKRAGADGRATGKPAAASDDSASGQAEFDYAKVGEHVSTVLEAAKAAAEKMLSEASKDARQLRADAQVETEVAIEEAKQNVEQARVEAARLHAEAKQRLDEVRDEADVYANGLRQAAEAEAAAILEGAEHLASERVDAAQSRQRILDRNIAAAENRLRQLVGGVRDLASGLEELVPPDPAAQQAAATELNELWPAPHRQDEQFDRAVEGRNGT